MIDTLPKALRAVSARLLSLRSGQEPAKEEAEAVQPVQPETAPVEIPSPAPVVPRVRYSLETRPGKSPERLSEDTVRGDIGLRLSTAALWTLLHRLGVDVANARGHAAMTSQVVFHSAQELLAHMLNVDPDTVRRCLRRLRTSGLVDYRGHSTGFGGCGAWTAPCSRCVCGPGWRG